MAQSRLLWLVTWFYLLGPGLCLMLTVDLVVRSDNYCETTNTYIDDEDDIYIYIDSVNR